MKPDACSPDAHNLLDLESALSKIFASLNVIHGNERIDIHRALGRILSATLTSPVNLPHERNSAMDGYAFCSQDLKDRHCASLHQVGTSLAGNPYTENLQAGDCVRIFTGAILPDNADSVIIQEQVRCEGNQVFLPENPTLRQNVRAIGEDIRQGEVLLTAGKKLNAADLAFLAATAIQTVEVLLPLKIAFCSTGDELQCIDQPLVKGKIYDSNRYLLQALLQNPAYAITDLGIIPDDPELLATTFKTAAAQHDVLISTGGVSVGDADHVKTVLKQCGEIHFWKLAIKPGKPLAFGKIDHCYFFGLPGNPVAVAATFDKIVTPALQCLCGLPAKRPLRLQAISLKQLKKAPGRMDFQRGILIQNNDGTFAVSSAGGQGSHILSALSHANCYIVLERERGDVQAGETVTVEPFETTLLP